MYMPRILITDLPHSGTKFHKSHKDPQDPQDVLSVRLYSSTKGDDASHVETVHIHKDGTYKSSKK